MPSLLDRSAHRPVSIPAGSPPVLVTTIDLEEQFDWSEPLSRGPHSIQSMQSLTLAHPIFDKYGVVPTYLATYPIVAHADTCRPLLELVQAGKCEIGAQLHPWVTPPFDEALNSANSFPGNLSEASETEKLRILTNIIAERLQTQPRIYRAGRYGVGPRTAGILKELGYQIDSSVVPEHNFGEEGGPNFFSFPPTPSWVGPGQDLLELPITAGYVGMLAGQEAQPLRGLFTDFRRFRLARSAAARLRFAERIRLTPEGTKFTDGRRLVQSLLRRGVKIFTLSYHSPSLVPGSTPYVRNQTERERLLDWLDRFYDFFINEAGGRPSTATGIFEWLNNPRQDGGNTNGLQNGEINA